MTIPDEDTIERLARKVIDRTLPRAEWTHAAHIAVALWLLRYRPDLTSPEPMRHLIGDYNVATGTPNTDTGGYHHTMTRATAHTLQTPLRMYVWRTSSYA